MINIKGETVLDNKNKAEALNSQYQPVFTKENTHFFPTPRQPASPVMPNIIFTQAGIAKLLHKLNPHKANGPDEIPISFLQNYSTEISKFLVIIFQNSYDSGKLPNDWLTANIAPVFKKGNKKLPSNYRPVSLTAVTCKIMEHIVHSHIITTL